MIKYLMVLLGQIGSEICCELIATPKRRILYVRPYRDLHRLVYRQIKAGRIVLTAAEMKQRNRLSRKANFFTLFYYPKRGNRVLYRHNWLFSFKDTSYKIVDLSLEIRSGTTN